MGRSRAFWEISPLFAYLLLKVEAVLRRFVGRHELGPI